MSRINELLTREAFSSNCSCIDLMSSLGLGCYEQRGCLRHYMLTNRKTGEVFDFTVNTARNEWISRRDGKQGQAADLLDYINGWETDKSRTYGNDVRQRRILRL